MFTNKFLTSAIALLVIAAAVTAESAAPEQEFAVASQVWHSMQSSDFVQEAAYTPQLLENVIALKAYCMAARQKVKANTDMKLDKNAILARFVLAYGKKPALPKGPKYNFNTMTFVRRQHKRPSVIADYARVMGTMRAKYKQGIGQYLFRNIDQSLSRGSGATAASGAMVMFSHKAIGFTHLPKYVVDMAVPITSVTTYSVMLAKINKNAVAEASRNAIERKEKAARAKAAKENRKKAAAKTKQAIAKAAAEKKEKKARSTANQIHEANRKAAVNEALKKAMAKKAAQASSNEQKRKVESIKRAKKIAKNTSASFKCTSKIKSTNNAGVVRVATQGGYSMTGGGMINNYRSWNKHAGFEEMMPEGNHFRCDMGFGAGRLHCYSQGCTMNGGLTCKTWSKRLTKSGVQRVGVGAGYTMTGGGIYNHYRHFNARSGFEESFPEGNTWRGDMGFGWGDFTVYARGCKANRKGHKLQCITAKGKSNANYAHATCPSGYQLTGCGINNHYRHFNKLSGFEATHPNGNKCSCDSGFGHGKNTCYARCCKAVSFSVAHLVKKEKSEKAALRRRQARENSEKEAARRAAAKAVARRKAAEAKKKHAIRAAEDKKKTEAKKAAARRAAARKAEAKRAEQRGERARKRQIRAMKDRMRKKFAEKVRKEVKRKRAAAKKMAAKIARLKAKAAKEAASKKRAAARKAAKKKAAAAAAAAKARKAERKKKHTEKKFKRAKSEKSKKRRYAKMKVAKAKAKAAKARARRAAMAKAKAARKKAAAARKERAAKAKAKAARRNAKSASPVVYQHCNFGGYRKVLRHSTDWVRKMGVRNDDLSSVKVPAGKCVVLYQHSHYKGKSWKICGKKEVRCFVHHKMMGGKSWNDQVSSIKVINAPTKRIAKPKRIIRKMDGSRRHESPITKIIRKAKEARQKKKASCKSEWKCLKGISTPVRLDAKTGHVSCMSSQGKHCWWGKCRNGKVPAHPKNIGKTSLICGAHHKSKWGGTGYGHKHHWCNKAKKGLGFTGKPCKTSARKHALKTAKKIIQKARIMDGTRRIVPKLKKLIVHKINKAKKAAEDKAHKIKKATRIAKKDKKKAEKKAKKDKKKAKKAKKKAKKAEKKIKPNSSNPNAAKKAAKAARAAKKAKERAMKARKAKAKKAAAAKRLRALRMQKARVRAGMRQAKIICHRANMAARKLKHLKLKAKKATYGSGAPAASFVQAMHHRVMDGSRRHFKRGNLHRAQLAHVLRLKRACTKALHAHSFAISAHHAALRKKAVARRKKAAARRKKAAARRAALRKKAAALRKKAAALRKKAAARHSAALRKKAAALRKKAAALRKKAAARRKQAAARRKKAAARRAALRKKAAARRKKAAARRAALRKRAAAHRRMRALRRSKMRVHYQMRRARKICHHAKRMAHKLHKLKHTRVVHHVKHVKVVHHVKHVKVVHHVIKKAPKRRLQGASDKHGCNGTLPPAHATKWDPKKKRCVKMYPKKKKHHHVHKILRNVRTHKEGKVVGIPNNAAETSLVQVMHHKPKTRTFIPKSRRKLDAKRAAKLAKHVRRLKNMCTKALHAHASAVRKLKGRSWHAFIGMA